jgi:hypothetical protein
MSVFRKSLPRSILATRILPWVTPHLPAATESRLPPRPGHQQPSAVSGGALAVNAGAASGEWTSGQIGGVPANGSLTFAAGTAFGVDTSGGDLRHGAAFSKAHAGLLKLGADTLKRELETCRRQSHRRARACQLPQAPCVTLPAPACRPEALAKSGGGVLGLTGGLGGHLRAAG